MKTLTIALIIAASLANATPWSVPDGNGGWKDNPDCTGSCRDTGIPDAKPAPERPAQAHERPAPRHTAQRQDCCILPDHRPFVRVFGGDVDATVRQCVAVLRVNPVECGVK